MSDLLDWARDLAPTVGAGAATAARERRLSDSIVGALFDADVFRLLVPVRYGGRELAFPDFMEMLEVFAAADASTAWCINQAAVHATMAAWCDPRGAAEIWADERCAIANGTPPPGAATPVEGGFTVDGRWSFSSGCEHANWVASLARIAGAEPAEFRFFYFPKDEVQFHDTWDVRGLAATASYDFSVDGGFVPAHRSATMVEEPPGVPGALYVIRPMLLFACGFSSVATGLARAALDDALAIVREKTARFSRGALKTDPHVMDQVGHAEARWRAARRFLFGTANEVWDQVVDAGEISGEQRVLLRMAATHCIRECAAVVDIAYNIGGTDAIHEAHPLHRRFQDMHVITQHAQARTAHYAPVGEFFVTGERPVTPHI